MSFLHTATSPHFYHPSTFALNEKCELLNEKHSGLIKGQCDHNATILKHLLLTNHWQQLQKDRIINLILIAKFLKHVSRQEPCH